MTNLLAAIMIVGLTLAQSGGGRVTSTDLAPPAGMGPASSSQTPSGAEAHPTSSTGPVKEKKPGQAPAKSVSDKAPARPEPAAPPPVVEEAQPVSKKAETASPPDAGPSSSAPESTRPAAATAGGKRRVAAFWFILPGN